MLLPSLAKKIIQEVRRLLDEDLIVADTSGMIIASTDQSRISTFHEGAFIACRQRQKLVITEADQQRLKGVKAGINLPILFHQDVIGVIGITGEPNKVSQYGELLKKMTELLIQESYYSEQFEWQSRTLEAFVFDWLQLKEWTKAFRDRGNLLGIDLLSNRQVIIASINEDENILKRNLWHYIQQWYDQNSKDIVVRWGNDRFVILQGITDNENKEKTYHSLSHLKVYIKEKCNFDLSIGIGQSVRPADLKRSYDQAERSLLVAKRTRTIIFDDDLRLEMCLQDISNHTRTEFVKRTIGQIQNEEELLITLKTFFSHNQSFKHTAEEMHIHINTLHYRLKKVEEATGLNPREFRDLVTLYLATLFLDDYIKNNHENG